MSILTTTLAATLLLVQQPASPFQVPEGGGIVYGSEMGVGVGAPPGWVFDAESGVPQGLHAVMYPEGSNWTGAKEIMYVNIAKLEEGQSLESFIASDVARFKQQAPDLVVTAADPIEVKAGFKAEVRHYTGDSWGNSEAVAYAIKDTSVAIYVLSCRTREGFARSLPSFRAMVAQSFLATMAFDK